MPSVEAAGPWEFGWEALVAIATFGLAATTVGLAISTRKVARAAAAEVLSQSRPVLVPATTGAKKVISVGSANIRIRIKNAGKGPAFEVQCQLNPDGSLPDAWHHGILEPGQDVSLVFPAGDGEPRESYELKASYNDLAGKSHTSTVLIKRVAQRSGTELRTVYACLEVVTD